MKKITLLFYLLLLCNSFSQSTTTGERTLSPGFTVQFDYDDIKVKCFNPHGLNNRDCYYPLVKSKNLFEPDFETCLFGNTKHTQKLL